MSARDEITGVILAAGRGTRMSALDTDRPKAVLPVANVPIACYQIRAMENLGLKEVYITVGHNGYEVVRHIERAGPYKLRIHYKHQAQALGIAHSIAILEPYISNSMLIFLGDIFVDSLDIDSMVEDYLESGAMGILASVEERDPGVIRNNFCIVEDGSGFVRKVIEKPRFPASSLKGLGIYLFNPVLFDSIRRTPKTAMRNEFEITNSIQIMIDDGHKIKASRWAARDYNITNAGDLLKVNMAALRRQGGENIIGAATAIGKGTSVKGSVIGSGVNIGEACAVENSVIFDDADVPENSVIKDAIVTERSRAS